MRPQSKYYPSPTLYAKLHNNSMRTHKISELRKRCICDLSFLCFWIPDHASADQVALFLAEASQLKRTTHHNVLPLMHVCCEGMIPLVIYPYMNRGNLKNYLRLSRTVEPLSRVSYCIYSSNALVWPWINLIYALLAITCFVERVNVCFCRTFA